MPVLPHPIYGTCTKADSSAYTGRVCITNENINQTVTTNCNSSGQYLYDLANMDSYSSGDILTIAIEAYAKKGYLLVRNSFEDTSVDTVEAGGKRLNTATLTMNFKVGPGVSMNKARDDPNFGKKYEKLAEDNGTDNCHQYLQKGDIVQVYQKSKQYSWRCPKSVKVIKCGLFKP